ncbi:MAG: hypothetical protein K9M12_02055 [Candidatus Pacebacteria bacterium]|nr:hypothetical protein [Candidatus Paceibacterota bacterium]
MNRKRLKKNTVLREKKEVIKVTLYKMKWELKISNSAEKFIRKHKLDIKEIILIAKKVTDYFQGESLNVDIKKLKGNWKGFYRVRKGKIRIILRFDFKKLIVFIEEMDYRKDAYK